MLSIGNHFEKYPCNEDLVGKKNWKSYRLETLHYNGFWDFA